MSITAMYVGLNGPITLCFIIMLVAYVPLCIAIEFLDCQGVCQAITSKVALPHAVWGD